MSRKVVPMEFKPIELDDYDNLKPYLAYNNEGICEYNFNILFLWYYVYKTQYCIIEDSICLLIQSYKGHTYSLMPLCDKKDYGKAFTFMENYLKIKEMSMEMYCVDQEFATYIEKHHPKYSVEEDRDSFDYIYKAKDLKTLKGNKYHKKRNHINNFTKHYKDRFYYRSLNYEDHEACCELIKSWRMRKGESSYDLIQGEILGIKHLFDMLDYTDIKVGGIFIDEELQAFAMGSYLNTSNKNMCVIHVEKANPNIRGLFPLINRDFLIHEFPDVIYVNREDDLGIEGMRQAKLSYRPIRFAKKYSILERG